MAQPKCRVPGCEGKQIPGRSPHGLCYKHEDMMNWFQWLIKEQRKQADAHGGLIIPGQQRVSFPLKGLK
jgi:hypothetical protein